jgi:hypothetical protein
MVEVDLSCEPEGFACVRKIADAAFGCQHLVDALAKVTAAWPEGNDRWLLSIWPLSAYGELQRLDDEFLNRLASQQIHPKMGHLRSIEDPSECVRSKRKARLDRCPTVVLRRRM